MKILRSAKVLRASGRHVLPGLLALLVASIPLHGCKSAREEARTFSACSSQRPCHKPNVCIRAKAQSKEGICVYPCARDGDCPGNFRCTGRFRLLSEQGQFCRRPSVDVGEDCSRLQDGCMPGLRCYKKRCRRECGRDGDCKDGSRRCIQILDDSILNKEKNKLYQVCLEATRGQGESCRSGGPFCARGHVCHKRRCLKTCTSDSGCGADQICDGSLYTGPRARIRAEKQAKPDLLYCRQAGKKNAYCNLKLDKSCARGLYCLGSRCREIRHVDVGRRCREIRGVFCEKDAVCYAGRCRRVCKTEADCPRRGKRRCEARSVHGRKVKICL